MSAADFLIIATFTAPELIGPEPALMLWLLPLAASISITYKATKLPKIKPANFIKEAAVLFASIVVFVVVIMLVLHAFRWLVSE
jgi:hypothetical protein